MKLLKKSTILVIIVACLLLAVLGCNKKDRGFGEINWRRNFAGEISFEEHSGEYIAKFAEEYPNFEVTKIRWQMIPYIDSKIETYIIEGVCLGEKVVVKYLMPDRVILGRVERPLNEEEMIDGERVEKSLNLKQCLTYTEISEIAQSELGGELVEIRISWKKEMPTVYLEVEKENKIIAGMTLNAVTGEIVQI